MNIKANTLSADAEVLSLSSQAMAEGRLSPTPEMPDIKEVLFVEGKARLLSAECVMDKIIADGNVMYFVIYLSADDTYESFCSSSAFKHSFDAPGVTADMKVMAAAVLTEIEFYMEGPRDIYVKGMVDINCMVCGKKDIDIAEFDETGLEMKKGAVRVSCVKETKTASVVIREDVRIPQTMPPVKNAVFVDGYAEIKNIASEDYKTAVEGDINIHIVYISSDENMPIIMLNSSVPFGEVVRMESLSAGDDVHVEADVEEINVKSIEDTPDLLSVDAIIKITVTLRGYTDMEYTEDMYSMTTMLEIKKDSYSLNENVVYGKGKVYEQDTVSITEPYPPVVRVIFTRANAFVFKAMAGRDTALVEGIIFYRLHYSSSSGIRVFRAEMPFKAEMPVEGFKKGMKVFARAFVENCAAEGSGREINVKCTLLIRVAGFGALKALIISDVSDTGEAVKKDPGMTVYFADGRETLWDIAKKFKIPVSAVQKYNAELEGENPPAGSKMLIFNKRQA